MNDDLIDLEFTYITPATVNVATPRRHRHEWYTYQNDGRDWTACRSCGKVKDVAVTRRSRNNRKRGGTWENECAHLLGGRRVGQLNLPWDVEVEGFARVQTKVLDRWPSLNSVVSWLDAIPAGRELRIVALKDTPGPGHPARRLVVMDADEFAAWHGTPR